MINWWPLTCACAFSVDSRDGDWANPDMQAQVNNICPRHQSMNDSSVFYQVFFNESVPFSDLMEFISSEVNPNITSDPGAALSLGIAQFINGEIVLSSAPFTADQITQIQNYISSNYPGVISVS